MAYTEFYCQTTGSNLNAGSTTADASVFTYASGSWVAATGVFTVASGDPLSDGVVVGDFASVYPDGSTVGVFVGRVTDRDATTITVSLTAKSGTAPTDGTNTRTLKIGGAWKGPNAAEDFPFGFAASAMTNAAGETPRINIKGGINYSITGNIAHSIAGPVRWQGYTAIPGDGGKATFDGGVAGAGYVLLTMGGGNHDLVDMIFQNNGATGNSVGVHVTSGETFILRCVFNNFRGIGLFINAGNCSVVKCEVYACNKDNNFGWAGFYADGVTFFKNCISHDNLGTNSAGFRNASNNACQFINCIADTNGNSGFRSTEITPTLYSGCEAYNNVLDGIELNNTALTHFYIENCNLIKNGQWGINGNGTGARHGVIQNCGFGSGTQANGSGAITGLSSMSEDGSVTYPANATPWVDPENGDFSINLAEAKEAGSGTFTQTATGYAGTVGFPDIGAAQSECAECPECPECPPAPTPSTSSEGGGRMKEVVVVRKDEEILLAIPAICHMLWNE